MKRWILITMLVCAMPILTAEDKPADVAAAKTPPDKAAPDKTAATRGGNAKAGTPRQKAGKPDAKTAKNAKGAEKGDADATAHADPASVEDKDDDTIDLISGDTLRGKIHKELADCVIMLMHKDIARITVPREKIKALNYSLANRLNALDKDDLVGKFKVAIWAMERNMSKEGIELFEDIKKEQKAGKEGPGCDLLKELGRAYEQRGQPDKAYDNYSEYLLGHPDDAEVADEVKKLEAQLKPKQTEADKPPAPPVEGLEADGNWQAETAWPNANPTTAAFTKDKIGNKMIVVQSPGGTKDKMAVSRYNVPPLNLSESKEMVFKAFNDSDKAVNLSCAFVNAAGEFFETKFTRLNPKQWSNVSFKVDGKAFKSTVNDFKEFNQELKGRDYIAKITFMVYDQRPVKLFIDALFFN